MKPVDQTEFMGNDGEKRGNCLMASLASILEVPLESMPVLTNEHDNGTWWNVLLRAAQAHGFTAIYWNNDSYVQAGDDNVEVGPFLPYGYHIASGPSPRGDFGHSVVALDGHIVHDPHPSRAGIKEITSWILIFPRASASRLEAALPPANTQESEK